MNTVTFGTLNSYTDFDLILSHKTIGSADAKTNLVEVPGADGVIDLTEYFGEVTYNNRTITLEFSTLGRFEDVYGPLCDAIHGKRMHVALSDDPDFYWIGRVSVGEWSTDKTVGKFTVEVDCEPYKCRNDLTTANFTVSGSRTQVFPNLKKKVKPVFTFLAAMGVAFGGNTYSVSAGTWSGIEFVQGENTVTFTGTGTVAVSYQERGL